MTTPTSTPVPSNKPQDLLFNAEALDYFLNSTATTFATRVSGVKLTITGYLVTLDSKVAVVEAKRASSIAAMQTEEGFVVEKRVAVFGVMQNEEGFVQGKRVAVFEAMEVQEGAVQARRNTAVTEIDGIVASTQPQIDAVLAGLNEEAAITETGINRAGAEAAEDGAAAHELGAQTARIGAEAARDALNTTGKVFTAAELADGTAIANTTAGQQFSALSVDLRSWGVYRNNAGSALFLSSTYTSAYIDGTFNKGLGNANLLFKLRDAQGRRILKMLMDATLIAKLGIAVGTGNGLSWTRQTDGRYTLSLGTTEGVLPLGTAGGKFDARRSNPNTLHVVTDLAGRRLARYTADGYFEPKRIRLPSDFVFPPSAEVATARGSRTALNDRLSGFLTDYGLPRQHLYNAGTLRETRMRLRQRKQGGAGTLRIALVGDSWLQREYFWSQYLGQRLIADYGDAGPGYLGFGWPVGTDVTVQNRNIDPSRFACTVTGAWATTYRTVSGSPDLSSLTSSTAGDTISCAWSGAGNVAAVDFWYIAAAGASIQYRYNGGSWTALNLAGTAGSGQHTALSAPPAGAWTLDLQVVAGSCQLCGVRGSKTTDGVIVDKLACAGGLTRDWTQVDQTQLAAAYTSLAPRLFVVLLDTNDQASYTAETMRGYKQTLISLIRTACPKADILLVSPAENTRVNANAMSSYQEVDRQLASVNKVAHLNLQALFGEASADYAFGSDRPLIAADTIHPTPISGNGLGGYAILDAVLEALGIAH